MLNSIIRADLHIHSKASEYREHNYKGTNESIVEYSDAEHLDVLLESLRSVDDPDSSIQLFSITDHDRFDRALYLRAVELLKTERYKRFASILPGVEFTVKLEKDRDPVHVITLFDVGSECWDDDWGARLCKIEDGISANKLEQKEGFYPFHDFIGLLSSIGYRAILIAHQFDGLGASRPRKTSLSRATQNPAGYLTYGVFDAIEYTRTRVEGILLNELTEQDLPKGMVAGSDCHDWRCYPLHDREATGKKDRFFTELRCLPTFRGLLCALTSASTRIRVSEYSDTRRFVESVFIEGVEIPLSPGLNAIIGENGSGKSTVLDVIGSVRKTERWHSGFVKRHSLSCPTAFGESERTFVAQGDLQKLYGENKGSLFGGELYPSIPASDNQQFEQLIREYSKTLKGFIREGITRAERLLLLETTEVELRFGLDRTTHALEVVVEEGFSELADPYANHSSKLQHAASIIREESETKEPVYTAEQINALREATSLVEGVRSAIQLKSDDAVLDAKARGVVERSMNAYSSELQAHRTTLDNKFLAMQESRRRLVRVILDRAKDAASSRSFPALGALEVKLGLKSIPKGGFEFVAEAKYHAEGDLFSRLLERVFNSAYRNRDALSRISADKEADDAVTGGAGVAWTDRWDRHVEEFIRDYEQVATYIASKPGSTVGGTLGEQSIAYYKFQSGNADRGKAILIDQPEDNVSNSSVASDLIGDISGLRYDRQVIIVTHNPMLVVNLDVDNAIVLEHRGGKLVAYGGCLESVDNGDILNLVANHMDGGSEAIKRRLKLYGQQ